jgi:DNA invertase Pin-like site-specific DNA recombinase
MLTNTPPPSLSERIKAGMARARSQGRPPGRPSVTEAVKATRKAEVLRLLSEGRNSKEVAALVGIDISALYRTRRDLLAEGLLRWDNGILTGA